MLRPAWFETLIYDATHAEDAVILAEARLRLAAGQSMRGLPRPHWAPPTPNRYALRTIHLRSGPAHYLLLRWRSQDGEHSRLVGRIDPPG